MQVSPVLKDKQIIVPSDNTGVVRVPREAASSPQAAEPVDSFGESPSEVAVANTSVDAALRAPEVKMLPGTQIPYGRPLTREDFGQREVIDAVGQQIAIEHKKAKIDFSRKELYPIGDARGRLINIKNPEEPHKKDDFKLNLLQFEAVECDLGTKLQKEAPYQITVKFNFYPDAMRFDRDGNLHLNADNNNLAPHADFFPLVRLIYTARLDHGGARDLLNAYHRERDGRDTTDHELHVAYQGMYLIDLLYYSYFVDCASTKGVKESDRTLHLAAAESIIDRLRLDQNSLTDLSMPALDLPEATVKPLPVAA